MKYSVHQTRENKYFKHGIQVFKMLDFHDARRWLTSTYGIGDDIGRDDTIINGHWAFFLKYNHYMIYVRDDEELAWFKMKHGQEVE